MNSSHPRLSTRSIIDVGRHFPSIVAIALALMAGSVCATDELPEGALRITPEELKWKGGRVPGHEIAPLIGDSTKPGPYVERVKFPPNSISQAHSHPESRMYTVISGTSYVGYGDKFNVAKLKALPPGSSWAFKYVPSRPLPSGTGSESPASFRPRT